MNDRKSSVLPKKGRKWIVTDTKNKNITPKKIFIKLCVCVNLCASVELCKHVAVAQAYSVDSISVMALLVCSRLF